MAVGLSALRSELLNDPAGIGYGSHVSAGNMSILTYMINTVSANSNAVASTITVGLVQAQALQIAVVASEYLALSAGQQTLWNAVLTAATTRGIAISNTVLRQQVTTVWSAATTTRTNLAALQTRRCSRGEAVFGEGAAVDVNEVSKAVDGDF